MKVQNEDLLAAWFAWVVRSPLAERLALLLLLHKLLHSMRASRKLIIPHIQHKSKFNGEL